MLKLLLLKIKIFIFLRIFSGHFIKTFSINENAKKCRWRILTKLKNCDILLLNLIENHLIRWVTERVWFAKAYQTLLFFTGE